MSVTGITIITSNHLNTELNSSSKNVETKSLKRYAITPENLNYLSSAPKSKEEKEFYEELKRTIALRKPSASDLNPINPELSQNNKKEASEGVTEIKPKEENIKLSRKGRSKTFGSKLPSFFKLNLSFDRSQRSFSNSRLEETKKEEEEQKTALPEAEKAPRLSEELVLKLEKIFSLPINHSKIGDPIKELIESEERYSNQLSYLERGYELYQKEKKIFSFLPKEQTELATQIVDQIFNQAILIRNQCSLHFFREMNLKLDGNEKNEEEVIKITIDTLKGINWDLYSKVGDYHRDYNRLQRDVKKKKDKLDQKLNALVINEEKFNFESLSITMSQRLVRLAMLIQEIRKGTSPTSPIYAELTTIWEKLSEKTAILNGNVRYTIMPGTLTSDQIISQ